MFCLGGGGGRRLSETYQPLLSSSKQAHPVRELQRALRNIKHGIFTLCNTQRPIFVCDGDGAGVSERGREREPARREIGCALCCIIWESQRHSSSRQMNGYLIASACVSCAYRISRCAHWIDCCCSQRPINFHGCTSALRNQRSNEDR